MIDKAQLESTRDALIAQKNGAIKYQPMLEDVQRGQGPLAMHKDSEADDIQAAVAAFADAAHKTAIERLRYELANDPDEAGYKGKAVEEIQALLMEQIPVYADVPAGNPHAEADYLAAKIRGEPLEQKPQMQQVLVTVKPPPISRVWQGIPYCRNLPSIDNIKEALQ